MGGYRVQGKSVESVKNLMQDIEALINAGVFSILLEAIPNQVTEMITKNFDIAFLVSEREFM